MAEGKRGSCKVCDAENAAEMHWMIVQGRSYGEIEELSGITDQTIINCVKRGHVTVCSVDELEAFREWARLNPYNGDLRKQKGLQKRAMNAAAVAFTEEKMPTAEQARLLTYRNLNLLLNYGMDLLQDMDRNKDQWTGLQELRRTLVDISRVAGVLRTEPEKPETIDSDDVQALRESIVDAFRKRNGDTPGITLEHRPLR